MKVELIADRVQDKEAIEKFLKTNDMAYSLHFRKGEPYRVEVEVGNLDVFNGLRDHLSKYKHVKENGMRIKINF